MSTLVTLFWVLFGFTAFTIYVSVAVVGMVIVRRRVMELTCVKGKRSSSPGYSDHLWCDTITSHWAGPFWAGFLWPLTAIPVLLLRRLHRDQLSLARIDRMEQELGMKR